MGHVHGGSMPKALRVAGSEHISYRSTIDGNPSALKYLAGSANVNAGVFDKRHGPCADLPVFQASRTVTPRLRNSR